MNDITFSLVGSTSRVPGPVEFGRARETTYEFDYSEQFSIKNDLDLRPDELEISRSIWSRILLTSFRPFWLSDRSMILPNLATFTYETFVHYFFLKIGSNFLPDHLKKNSVSRK